MSGRKPYHANYTIGMVNTISRIVEHWPPKTRFCGVQLILLDEDFLHFPKHLVFGFRHKFVGDVKWQLYNLN